ncbi:hypothetical protein C8F04DRAFT_1163 [Mycena alexandri]|uniref:Uncharacterized protein n=1 Tax=Mycena alexandri TaxID=1745969 RepID=A0AAD6TL15_9AGAR|nr:hypothetical protein C8F04DRAFT_1163 [Mycena alexandri]
MKCTKLDTRLLTAALNEDGYINYMNPRLRPTSEEAKLLCRVYSDAAAANPLYAKALQEGRVLRQLVEWLNFVDWDGDFVWAGLELWEADRRTSEELARSIGARGRLNVVVTGINYLRFAQLFDAVLPPQIEEVAGNRGLRRGNIYSPIIGPFQDCDIFWSRRSIHIGRRLPALAHRRHKW